MLADLCCPRAQAYMESVVLREYRMSIAYKDVFVVIANLSAVSSVLGFDYCLL